jgi:tRNA (guanine-N7-)-methyltransferase
VSSSAPPDEEGDAPRGPWPERQFYGRQKARPLRPRQQERLERLLPRLKVDILKPAPARLAALFGGGFEDVWLEIGFGGGEHLAWQAGRNPDIGFIGVEPFINGVVSLLGHVEERGLDNVLIFDREAAAILEWLPDASIGRAFILFPDPWPKARHRKRRLVSQQTLARLARVMKRGAELRIATDIGDYALTTLLALQAVPAFRWQAKSARDWRERPSDWPETRYEAKARAAGRRRYYFRYVKG